MKNNITLVFILSLIYSCDHGNTNNNFNVKTTSLRKIEVDRLDLIEIKLDSTASSYNGNSGIINDKIYYFDNYLCEMCIFDTLGNFVDKKLGKGNAKNEIQTSKIDGHVLMNNGELILFDASGSYYLYDKDFNRKNMFRIIYDRNYPQKNIYSNPNAYTHRYNDLVCRGYDSNIFFNVHLATETHNHLTTQAQHLTESCNILEVDINDKKVSRLLAKGYPSSYKKDPNTKAILSSVNFDIGSDGAFYVTYETDSLIYVYDKNYKIIDCYGYKGSDMDTNYKETNIIKEVGRYYRDERNKRGYYNWLEYVDETGILFRSYKKGSQSEYDGLQIYKDNVLIGDIAIPKSFRVMGYIYPYYYSHIIDNEGKENMVIYKFMLPLKE